MRDVWPDSRLLQQLPERMPAMSELTRAQKSVMSTLRFRETLGLSWLRAGTRSNTRRLWVPTMMADRHIEPLFAYSDSTIVGLISAGLVEVGPFEQIDGSNRWGERITLVAAVTA